MPQNGEIHFKNPAVFDARFCKSMSNHFGTLCIKKLSWVAG